MCHTRIVSFIERVYSGNSCWILPTRDVDTTGANLTKCRMVSNKRSIDMNIIAHRNVVFACGITSYAESCGTKTGSILICLGHHPIAINVHMEVSVPILKIFIDFYRKLSVFFCFVTVIISAVKHRTQRPP